MSDDELVQKIIQGGDEELRKLLDSNVLPNTPRRIVCAAVAMLRADRNRYTAAAAILFEACERVEDELDEDSPALAAVQTAMKQAVRHDCVSCRTMTEA